MPNGSYIYLDSLNQTQLRGNKVLLWERERNLVVYGIRKDTGVSVISGTTDSVTGSSLSAYL